MIHVFLAKSFCIVNKHYMYMYIAIQQILCNLNQLKTIFFSVVTDREIVRFRFFCMSEYPIDAIFLSSSHFYKCLVIVNSLSPPKDFK